MEARGVLDDRHQPAVKFGLQFREAGVGRQGFQLVGHGTGHVHTEVRSILVHPQQNIGLVDHPDQALPVQHWQLRHIRQAHALEGGE
ncbi:hypothetical protein D3C76_1727680 [compost metagenome]